MLSDGCENVVDKPTRFSHHSETLTDLCFTNLPSNKITSEVILTNLSDLLPLFAFFFGKKKWTELNAFDE